jgi:hypothetical protein
VADIIISDAARQNILDERLARVDAALEASKARNAALEAAIAAGPPGSRRNIGSPSAPATKPDGTPPVAGTAPGNVSTGSAKVTTSAIPTSPFGTTEAAAVVPSILKSQTTTSTSSADALSSIQLNPLEKFASYSPLWTMACLEPKQYNRPESYRNNPADLKHIIMSSAGRFDDNRVQTSQGVPEFFINNFII